MKFAKGDDRLPRFKAAKITIRVVVNLSVLRMLESGRRVSCHSMEPVAACRLPGTVAGSMGLIHALAAREGESFMMSTKASMSIWVMLRDGGCFIGTSMQIQLIPVEMECHKNWRCCSEQRI